MIDVTQLEYDAYLLMLVNPTIETKEYCGCTVTEHYTNNEKKAIKLENEITRETKYKTL